MTMKKASFPLLILAAASAWLLVGCAAGSHIEKADDVNFSHYRTFSFTQRDGNPQQSHNDIIDANVRKAITEEMEKKGLRHSDRNPDVNVEYSLNVERGTARERDPVYSSPYTQPFYNPASRRIGYMYMPSQMMGYNDYNRTVKNGTLTISIYDANKERLIWQGWTQNELNKGNFTSNDVRTDVRSILKKLDSRG